MHIDWLIISDLFIVTYEIKKSYFGIHHEHKRFSCINIQGCEVVVNRFSFIFKVKLDKLAFDLCPIQYAPIDVETGFTHFEDAFPKKEKQVSWSACARRKLCNRESETTVTQKDELEHVGG